MTSRAKPSQAKPSHARWIWYSFLRINSIWNWLCFVCVIEQRAFLLAYTSAFVLRTYVLFMNIVFANFDWFRFRKKFDQQSISLYLYSIVQNEGISMNSFFFSLFIIKYPSNICTLYAHTHTYKKQQLVQFVWVCDNNISCLSVFFCFAPALSPLGNKVGN